VGTTVSSRARLEGSFAYVVGWADTVPVVSAVHEAAKNKGVKRSSAPGRRERKEGAIAASESQKWVDVESEGRPQRIEHGREANGNRSRTGLTSDGGCRRGCIAHASRKRAWRVAANS
jgi:hypothetical protein